MRLDTVSESYRKQAALAGSARGEFGSAPPVHTLAERLRGEEKRWNSRCLDLVEAHRLCFVDDPLYPSAAVMFLKVPWTRIFRQSVQNSIFSASQPGDVTERDPAPPRSLIAWVRPQESRHEDEKT